MQIEEFGANEAGRLFRRLPDEKAWQRAIRGSRALASATSPVLLPDTVKLPTDRPAIIAANHTSLFDLPAALLTLAKYDMPARIGVNSRFFKNPIAGRFLRSIDCIPFSRDDRQAAEDTMVDALLSGQSAAIMPEGKLVRSKDWVGGAGPARPGVSRIARRAGAAVVPVGFAFCDEVWQPGSPLPRPARRNKPVIATIGEPLWFEDDDHEANAAALMAAIGACAEQGRATR